MAVPFPDYKKLSKSTGMCKNTLKMRKKEFDRKFPSGQVTREEFRQMAAEIMPEKDIAEFVKNIFKLFDVDKNRKLNFEEFTLATNAEEMGERPGEKMEWIFENVYDKDGSGDLSREEMDGILNTLLKMEHIPEQTCKEMTTDIFKEIDTNNDGSISKEEFVKAAKSSELLSRILSHAAEKEQRRMKRKKSKKRKSEESPQTEGSKA